MTFLGISAAESSTNLNKCPLQPPNILKPPTSTALSATIFSQLWIKLSLEPRIWSQSVGVDSLHVPYVFLICHFTISSPSGHCRPHDYFYLGLVIMLGMDNGYQVHSLRKPSQGYLSRLSPSVTDSEVCPFHLLYFHHILTTCSLPLCDLFQVATINIYSRLSPSVTDSEFTSLWPLSIYDAGEYDESGSEEDDTDTGS